MQRRDISIISPTQVKAVFISPPSTAKKMAMGFSRNIAGNHQSGTKLAQYSEK